MTTLFMLRVAVVAAAAAPSLALKMARLTSESGSSSVTSSTLAWVAAGGGERLPAHTVAVDLSTGPGPGPFWCRGRYRGFQLPGMTSAEGPCRVPFLNKVQALERYDVLVSVNGSARLHLRPWDSFTAKPDSAVTTPDRLLAAAPLDDGPGAPMLVGSLGPRVRDRQAFLVAGEGEVVERGKAYVVVEEEPVRYSVTQVVLDGARQRQHNSTVTLLGPFNLTNPLNHSVALDKEFLYHVPEEQYWGRVKGTVTALRVDVTLPLDAPVVLSSAGSSLALLWGINNQLKSALRGVITHRLPAATGVEVEVEGVMRHYEAPYTATLTAHYEDGTALDRPIHALHKHVARVEVVVLFTRYFSLEDGSDLSIMPTADVLFQLTTTTTTTTTTTEPPTTTEAPTEAPTEAMAEVSWQPESDSLSKDLESEEYREGEVVAVGGQGGGGEPSQGVVTARPFDRILSALASLTATLMLRYFSSL